MRKFRKYKGVIQELKQFSPDVILFHGCCAQAITEVSEFTRNNPNVVLYVDSHEDFNTAAKGFISREILHKIIIAIGYRRAPSNFRYWQLRQSVLSLYAIFMVYPKTY